MPEYYTYETDPTLATVRELDQLKLRLEELERERDEARKARLAQKDTLMYLERMTQRLLEERRSALRERDEARKTARQLFRLFRRELDVLNWLEHDPWLKEAPGREGER